VISVHCIETFADFDLKIGHIDGIEFGYKSLTTGFKKTFDFSFKSYLLYIDDLFRLLQKSGVDLT
jgi:hypothetical protein